MSAPHLPDPTHSALVARATSPVREAHEWTGDDDNAGHHHGLLDANEVPCFISLNWRSKRAGRTVPVGTYKLNLRRLAKAGYATEKPNNKVRLRFVRNPDGAIAIRVNESTPSLLVGRADF